MQFKHQLISQLVDMTISNRGGLTKPTKVSSPREIYLLQRKETKVGKGLGKTTAFGHRASLTKRNVKMLNGCKYIKFDEKGLLISRKGKEQLLEVDQVVICAGQVPLNHLLKPLEQAKIKVHLIGGAKNADKLDAKIAIKVRNWERRFSINLFVFQTESFIFHIFQER